MKPWWPFLLVLLGAPVGCGDENDGTGGSGGDPLVEQSAYRLSCTIDALVLEFPIELTYALDRPYVAGGSAELAFSATVTFSEQTSTALIDAGVDKVDIISLEIAASVEGATPTAVETSLDAAPINDFDLTRDTDDNGAPGPHVLDLEPVTRVTTVDDGAQEVVFSVGTEQISMVLGDFMVPEDCTNPTLVGSLARFPVEPG